MAQGTETESRKLLSRLQSVMADASAGQERLDRITHLIADSMGSEVCSIYLLRDADTLELCATEGLAPEAVHVTRMKIGEGLVGRVARSAPPADQHRQRTRRTRLSLHARDRRGTYTSFLGVPIQRLGEAAGRAGGAIQGPARILPTTRSTRWKSWRWSWPRWTELGAFIGEGAALAERHKQQVMLRGTCVQEGTAMGHVWLHEPRVVVTNLVSDDPDAELVRLKRRRRPPAPRHRRHAHQCAPGRRRTARGAGGLPHVRPFARLDAADGGRHRARPERRGGGGKGTVDPRGHGCKTVPDAYLRERLHDLDDPVEPPAAPPDRPGPRHRRRPARRPGSGGAQHRAGRVAGLRAPAAGRGAGGGLRRGAMPPSSRARWRSRWSSMPARSPPRH